MIKHLLIISLALFSLSTSIAAELPDAPSGYEWVRCGDNKMGLLKPKKWFHRERTKGDTETHAVSVENSRKNGIFDTGLTLNIMKHVDKKFGAPPSVFAKKFVERACAEKTVLLDVFSKPPMGPFKSYGCRIKSRQDDDIPIVIHYFVLANDQTGTVFIYQFEAPADRWNKAWKTGEFLMQKIWVDDEV